MALKYPTALNKHELSSGIILRTTTPVGSFSLAEELFVLVTAGWGAGAGKRSIVKVSPDLNKLDTLSSSLPFISVTGNPLSTKMEEGQDWVSLDCILCSMVVAEQSEWSFWTYSFVVAEEYHNEPLAFSLTLRTFESHQSWWLWHHSHFYTVASALRWDITPKLLLQCREFESAFVQIRSWKIERN